MREDVKAQPSMPRQNFLFWDTQTTREAELIFAQKGSQSYQKYAFGIRPIKAISGVLSIGAEVTKDCDSATDLHPCECYVPVPMDTVGDAMEIAGIWGGARGQGPMARERLIASQRHLKHSGPCQRILTPSDPCIWSVSTRRHRPKIVIGLVRRKMWPGRLNIRGKCHSSRGIEWLLDGRQGSFFVRPGDLLSRKRGMLWPMSCGQGGNTRSRPTRLCCLGTTYLLVALGRP